MGKKPRHRQYYIANIRDDGVAQVLASATVDEELEIHEVLLVIEHDRVTDTLEVKAVKKPEDRLKAFSTSTPWPKGRGDA